MQIASTDRRKPGYKECPIVSGMTDHLCEQSSQAYVLIAFRQMHLCFEFHPVGMPLCSSQFQGVLPSDCLDRLREVHSDMVHLPDVQVSRAQRSHLPVS